MTADQDTLTMPIREAGLPQASLLEVNLNVIARSLTNPRKMFDQVKLQELADDIRDIGVHTPVLLRPLPGHRVEDTRLNCLPGDPLPMYELVYGERRYRASLLAGVPNIIATVRDLSDNQVLEIQVTENLLRDDLLPLEEAEGFQQLMDHRKLSAKEVGLMIKRSGRYVYASIQLLKLGGEAREALAEKRLEKSQALLVATVLEPKLQAKALQKALERDYTGHTTSVRALDEWITTNCRLKLSTAKFNIKDATLRNGAGPCGVCPKRTGADPDLFADYSGPDMCLDPGCFHDKRQTHADRELESAERAGRRVFRDEKAASLLKYEHGTEVEGYEKLDAYPSYLLGDLSGGTLRKALGKHCPEETILVHPKTGEHIAVIRTDLAKQIIAEHKLTRGEKQKQNRIEKEQVLPVEQRLEYRNAWRDRVVKHAASAVTSGTELPLLELLMAFMAQELHDSSSFGLGQALGLGEDDAEDDELVQARLVSTPVDEAPKVFARWLLNRYAFGYRAFDEDDLAKQAPRHPIMEIFRYSGTDIEAIKADVKREIESAERAEAMAADAAEASLPLPSAAQANGVRGEKKKGKGKNGPAAQAGELPKSSPEFVKAQIADAMQALEGEGPGSADAPQSDDAVPVLRQAQEAMPAPADDAPGTDSGAAEVAQVDEGQAVLRQPAGDALPFAIGQSVKFKAGIRGPDRHVRKVAGRAGTIESRSGACWMVRTGPASYDLARAREDEIEAVGPQPTEADGCIVNQRVKVRDHASPAFAGQLGRIVAVSANGHAWDVRLDPAGKKKARVETFAEGELEVVPA